MHVASMEKMNERVDAAKAELELLGEELLSVKNDKWEKFNKKRTGILAQMYAEKLAAHKAAVDVLKQEIQQARDEDNARKATSLSEKLEKFEAKAPKEPTEKSKEPTEDQVRKRIAAKESQIELLTSQIQIKVKSPTINIIVRMRTRL